LRRQSEVLAQERSIDVPLVRLDDRIRLEDNIGRRALAVQVWYFTIARRTSWPRTGARRNRIIGLNFDWFEELKRLVPVN
jgi:hypothetical protein